MTEIQATLLSGFIGTIIGAIIGGISTYVGAVRISDRERQYKIFNDTADALRYSLIKTQQRLEIIKRNRTATKSSEDIAADIIKEDFLIHDELARRFQLCITGKDFSFTKLAIL